MTDWTAKAERGSAWLIRLIVWLARTGGRTLCRGLLYPITLYFVLTDRMARRASREFLASAGGTPAGWRQVFRHLYTFATTLLDRVYLAAGDFHRFDIEIVGLDLQADGGTHVANTREVGSIRVTGYESKGRINKRIRIELLDPA